MFTQNEDKKAQQVSAFTMGAGLMNRTHQATSSSAKTFVNQTIKVGPSISAPRQTQVKMMASMASGDHSAVPSQPQSKNNYAQMFTAKQSARAPAPQMSASNQRTFMVGGNWKCNGTQEFAETFPKEVLNKLKFDSKNVEVMVCPTALHLSTVKSNITNDVHVGMQNLSLTGNGAYTGEFSVEMIKDMNVSWALTGHSERRTLFGESDQDVAKKTKAAVDSGITVLACIGEVLEERETGKTREVNERQLDAINDLCDENDWSKIVIAYEPVWAIGTGKTATPEIAQETHAEIREWLGKNVSEKAMNTVRILYGGSVSDANAADLIKQKDIDGFLVGGASLKPAFSTIVEACNDEYTKTWNS